VWIALAIDISQVFIVFLKKTESLGFVGRVVADYYIYASAILIALTGHRHFRRGADDHEFRLFKIQCTGAPVRTPER
jgi:hypothetical protein